MKHPEAILVCHGLSFWIGFDHHEGHRVPLQLGCNLLPDPAVAAKNHVVVKAFQHAEKAELPQSAEISRLLQPENALDGQLHNHQATHHDQDGDQAAWR